jgi:2-polyprenyl-3-methyl-5-hydroxy-6-metoxy-1,4-benzoquinol methylase
MSEAGRLDAVASWYDARTDFDRHTRRHIASLVQTYRHGDRLLEAGCGTGALTRYLTGHITAIDGSAKCIAACREQTWDIPIEFQEVLLEDFTPTGPRFEDIVMAGLLEHVEDPQAVLRRAHDWLAPEGRLHVSVPNGSSLHRRVGVAMGVLPTPNAMTERDAAMGHRRVYLPHEIRHDLEAGGWTIRHWEGILLKPLSSSQMNDWSDNLIAGLIRVGQSLPEWCAELYFLCEKQAAPS